MEFLQLLFFLFSALMLYFKPELKFLAVCFAVLGCLCLIALEFYVNLWVVIPIGNL
ncbi:hypothetical protein [Campylobacter majalis]|uniref:hypothetical protein n=1 Tax=Campylobacter majalis TaxID=2790656 RepID=UPI003D689E77